MSTSQPDRDKEEWKYDWDDHALAQLQGWLETTPAQRLAWLEEARELARLSASHRDRSD